MKDLDKGRAVWMRAGIAGARLSRGLRALRSDCGGNTLILAAFLFPVVIGGMGLGAETGYWYLTQRKLQHAADVSAHAAAVRKRAGDSKTEIRTVALDIAKDAGFRTSIGTITVNTPPTSGFYAGQTTAVEVVLTETFPRMFSGLFDSEPLTLTSRAVAQLKASSVACVLALSRNASAAASVSGSTTLSLDGCEVVSNSMADNAFSMQGSARLTTDCVRTVGGAVTTAYLTLNKCASVEQHAPETADPYADVAEPGVEGPCNQSGSFGGNGNNLVTVNTTGTHSSGVPFRCFGGGLTIQGNVEFRPGLYIVNGGAFKVNANAVVKGTGVTFLLTNGAKLDLNGSATFTLKAPTDASNPYKGILFFGSRKDTGVTHSITGGSTSVFQGAVYAAASRIQYAGGASSSGGCTQIIGDTVEITGNSRIGSTCTSAGTTSIGIGQVDVVK